MARDNTALAAKFVDARYGNPSTLRYYRQDWWIWTGGHYSIVSDEDLQGFLLNWLHEEKESCTIAAVREVHKALKALTNVAVSGSLDMPMLITPSYYDDSCNFLAFQDQIVDLDVLVQPGVKGMYRAPNPNWFSPVVLDYKYDPAAGCLLFMSFLDDVLPDASSQDVLQEWFGYCLTRDTEFRAMLILYGEARTGKSTLSNILEAMIGPDNRSAVPLECFWDRFTPHLTVGKLVNFCGDSSKIDSLAEGVIKRFTGGDTILVERKYKDPVSYKMTAKIVVATNVFPKIKDISDALWDRFIVVPMNHRISDKEMNLSLLGSQRPDWPFRKELPGIFNWAIRGLRRLKKNKRFTVSQALDLAKAVVRFENCSVAQFVADRCEASPAHSVPVRDFMREYTTYCDNQNLDALSSPQVGRLVKKALPEMGKKRLGTAPYREMHYVGVKMIVPR